MGLIVTRHSGPLVRTCRDADRLDGGAVLASDGLDEWSMLQLMPSLPRHQNRARTVIGFF